MVLIKDVETSNADPLVDVAHADVVVTAEVVNTLDDLSDKKKRIYCCSKCGQPKKGHQCQIPDDEAPPSPESKKRKMNEDNKSEDEQIKDDKDVKEDGSKSPNGQQLHQLHNHLHVVHTDADLDHSHVEETGLEVSVNPEDLHDADMRELDLFRKRVVRLCSRLQDTCSNLDENYHLYFRKVKQLALELEGVLVQLERYYLHSKDKEPSNDNVSWQYYQDGKDDHKLNDSVDLKILSFCEVFAIDLLNEWYDDKGYRNYIEERLFLLWEKAFDVIAMQSIVSPKELEKPLEAATSLDFKGRLKLNFGHHAELNNLAIKYQTLGFKQNPNFNVYKTLMDKMCMDRDSEYFNVLKNDLIDYLLNSTKPEHTVVKLQIMMFEKKYEQLKMLMIPLKSNDLVIEIAEQLAMLYPSDILNKAQKEIHQALLDNVPRLEERFSPSGKAFEVWKSEGFKTLKERMQEAKNRKERKEKKKIPHNIFVPEDYEEDHYVHQLRETFTIDELEMNYYDTYIKKYSEFENIPDAFFEEPYESFKEMRLTERECAKVQHTVISWFKIARLAITSFNSIRRDMNLNQALSFESFVDGMQGIFIETIRSFGKEYLGIICSEMSSLSWDNILEREFIQLCSLYASFYTRTLLDFLEKKDQYFVVRLEQQM